MNLGKMTLLQLYWLTLPDTATKLLCNLTFVEQLSKWDTDSHKSKDFLLNPICILYIIVCLYMLFYVQSIQNNMFKPTLKVFNSK